MGPSKAYEVQLGKAAARQLRNLDRAEAARVSDALSRLAIQLGTSSGSRGGNSLKKIRGRHDRFYRLRVDELRVMFELLHENRAVLVHAVVDRRDLDRWLRGR
jgi:mRNA-degrading endonuclease RelE of RelBE toxin-antitoxin system